MGRSQEGQQSSLGHLGEPRLPSVAIPLLLHLFFASVCRTSSLSNSSPPNLPEDGRALLSFLGQFAEGSAVREALTLSWSPDSSGAPCSWYGVGCDPFSQRVVSLILSGPASSTSSPSSTSATPAVSELASLTHLQNISLTHLGLSGPLPFFDIAAKFPKLRFLNLSNNAFTDSLHHLPLLCARIPSLTVVDIMINHISGSIPLNISLCENLTSLFLQDNNLSGSIPPSIGQLSLLQVFKAGGNTHLSGSLPSELGNCTSLVNFGVAETGISGAIPSSFGRLSKLKELYLSDINLSGQVPRELGNCTSLEVINIDKNKLNGVLPQELGRLQNLKWFNAWGNHFSGIIPWEMGMLRSLQMLDLTENELVGSIPASFGQLVNVRTIHLSMNYLTGGIPRELSNCSGMVDLELDQNMLSGTIPHELGNLSSLEGIYLWNNSLEGQVPATLSNCRKLTAIDLSWNLLSGPLLVDVFTLPLLEEIIVLGNSFSGEIPAAMATCKQLTRLRLNNNKLIGQIPSEIGMLDNLVFFDISRNQISGKIPESIANCTRLQLFDANENLLGGDIPVELGLLSNLEYLDISHNYLEGILPPSLGRLQNLSVLILSSNRLSGPIAAELEGCQKLTYLDLSSNVLSGVIPPSLGQISGLGQSINISCNSLSGPIPDTFVQLTYLVSIDVSHNALSGYLDVFSKMGSLISLNISHNLFSGKFPNSSLFRSMPASDYESCFATADTHRNRNILTTKLVIMPFAATAGLFLAVACFMIFSMMKRSFVSAKEPKEEWAPWVLTPFQKLHFTMEDVLDQMLDVNIVGKGCSGVVYKAVMPRGDVIAVKRITMISSAAKEPPEKNFFNTEMETLRSIRHRNIVRLLGFCTNHQSSLLLYDFMNNGSLEQCIHNKRGVLDWDARYNIALGTAQGLAYLHHDCMPPILHRDVKASNILLGAHFEPYLADFGLAKSVVSSSHATRTMLAGSYGYIAPEYAYALNITEKSDVYSYGVVLLELLTGKRPVEASFGEGRHLVDWVHEMRHLHHDVLDILDPQLRGMSDPFVKEMLQILNLALECVHPLSTERPSMRHVVTLLLHIRQPHFMEFSKLDLSKMDALTSQSTSSSYLSNKETHTYFSSPRPSIHLSNIHHFKDDQSKG
ncbi:hypothetical protein KP509_20G018300 [Ceratopteris richardii]|uniref:Protein kinase domain-containing protein n=1 Tax=Ceratopteris richardii TaxID=49495 RepID=A0A8T2SDH6_CERRI|nr:hypothetical protein KP509_20G018300 [Ceratopteris richardii]